MKIAGFFTSVDITNGDGDSTEYMVDIYGNIYSMRWHNCKPYWVNEGKPQVITKEDFDEMKKSE